MDLSFLGYGEQAATFEADSTLQTGDLVKMNNNFKVEPADTDGDVFCGQAINVRGDYATIQLSGYMVAEYSGTVSLGYQTVAIDENGKVEVVTTGGNKVLIINIDSTNGTIGFIL